MSLKRDGFPIEAAASEVRRAGVADEELVFVDEVDHVVCGTLWEEDGKGAGVHLSHFRAEPFLIFITCIHTTRQKLRVLGLR